VKMGLNHKYTNKFYMILLRCQFKA
jgi:hypothetical protein